MRKKRSEIVSIAKQEISQNLKSYIIITIIFLITLSLGVFLIYKINIIFIKKICNKICLWRSWLLSQVFFIFKVSIFNNKRSWSNHGLLLFF